MILVVVYVGAVAVLFLFVVMMLDVDFAELKEGFLQYLPVGMPDRRHRAGRTGHLWSALGGRRRGALTTPTPQAAHNTAAIGHVLYTNISISSRRRASCC